MRYQDRTHAAPRSSWFPCFACPADHPNWAWLGAHVLPCHLRGRTGRGLTAASHLTSGSTSYWWNGGGDGRVHSRVVAPGPQGLLAALSLRIKARTIP